MNGSVANIPESIVRRSAQRLRARANSALSLILEVLREIFDEAAYERFLRRHSLPNSRGAYAHFVEEQDVGRKPRCC
jgi:hypothetical protein